MGVFYNLSDWVILPNLPLLARKARSLALSERGGQLWMSGGRRVQRDAAELPLAVDPMYGRREIRATQIDEIAFNFMGILISINFYGIFFRKETLDK
jgi:hypothetical protein